MLKLLLPVQVERHPDADGLYVEQIDLGEPSGPRTIVSGLVAFCTEADLQDKEVLVLANLKPVSMRGIASAGMVLCASNEDHTKVSPLKPPAGVPLGELVVFEGHASAPVEPGNRAGQCREAACLLLSARIAATSTVSLLCYTSVSALSLCLSV